MAASTDGSDAPRSRREPGMFVALRAGQPIMVQLPTDSQRYWGRVVGADPYDCFIIKLPMVPGILRLAAAGVSLTLRMEAEGELYGFTCDIISVVFKPYPLLVLNYPASVERLQLRRFKRVRCLIPSILFNDSFNSSAFMLDISRGGCKLLLDMHQKQKIVSLLSGDRADLQISLDSRNPLRLPTEVVGIQDQGAARFVCTRFDANEEDEAQASLVEFMARLEFIENIVEQNCKS